MQPHDVAGGNFSKSGQMMMRNCYILTFSCLDRPGIVAAIAGLLAGKGGNIHESQQFDDLDSGKFFMRVVFAMPDHSLDGLRQLFAPLVAEYGMDMHLRCADEKMKAVILLSKFDHCLGDLLYRVSIGELPMDIVAVIGNHPLNPHMQNMIGDIPFHHLPVSAGNKAEQETEICRIIDGHEADLVILARYMQILSDRLAAHLSGRCINIHHSFLPGFKGAKPYHQAHARGVKMIGATAHYVTADLDEGPIIHQDVEAISHADHPEDLVRKGRDIERRVLATAVGYHLADRVLLNGNRTVVFRT